MTEMNLRKSTFSKSLHRKCSICGERVMASNCYKNKEKNICEDCYIETRINRSRKTHWHYIKSVKADYLVPSKTENNLL